MDWRAWMIGLGCVVGCGDSGGSATDGGGSEGDDDGSSAASADDGVGSTSGVDGSGGGGTASGTGGVIGGCGSEGWSTVEMPWSQLQYEGEPEGGFSICVPDAWTVTSDASNIIQLQRDGQLTAVLSLGGELRLDHEDALGRLAEQVLGWCSAPDYMRTFVAIDGWPALQLQYTFEPPACGECPDPVPPQAYAVSTHAATGVMLVNLVAQIDAPPDPVIVDELVAIGHTLHATGVGASTADQTAAEIAELDAQAVCM